MRITAGNYLRGDHGYPFMELTIDGYRCTFGTDIKRTILDEFGAVYVDGYPRDKLPVIDAPKYELTFKGFTTDKQVVALVRRFLASLDDSSFTVGEIDVNV